MVDDLDIPGRYPDVAAALEAELDEGRADRADLHARLAALDPVAAARMEPTNRRRVVRALEVTLGSGRPFSAFGPGLEAYPAERHGPGRPVPADPTRSTAGSTPASTAWSRPAWSTRCGRWPPGPAASRGRPARPSGYREILAHVEDGAPLAECLEEAVRRTRQFARRQASWFRRDPRVRWAGSGAEAQDLLEQALAVHG